MTMRRSTTVLAISALAAGSLVTTVPLAHAALATTDPSATATATDTASATPSDTASATPSDTATATPSDTASATPSDSPSATSTASATDTASATPSDTASATPSTTSSPRPRTVRFVANVTNWYMATPEQVAAAKKLVAQGQFAFPGHISWNWPASAHYSRTLKSRGLPVSRTLPMTVTVAANATPDQVLAAEKTAAAKATGVTVGVFATPTLGKTYRSVQVTPVGHLRITPAVRASLAVGSVNI